MNKAHLTFTKIYSLAYEMSVWAQAASLEKDEDVRDGIMEKIIELDEKIEKLYSSNWH